VDIAYGPARADGTIVALYQGARVQLEDAESGDQNVLESAASFLANTVGVRPDNRPDPGDAPREGRVDYPIEPGKPFFAILWEALRDGLLDLVLTVNVL
jgi:hypothetical protein